MNLTQALKGNMGDPAGKTCTQITNRKKHLLPGKEQDKTERKGMNNQACRKSDEAIVVMKSL
jgi:hypothetical protein